MLAELIKRNRSYRRFYQDEKVELDTLKELVNLARLSPTGGNVQPLKYILSNDAKKNELIFPYLVWAGYLKDWVGPAEGERPGAYIIIVGDTQINQSFGCDYGIAGQSMLLGAVEKGLGGCMIGSIQREKLRKSLNIPERYQILLILALGKPKEKVVIESVGPDNSIKYWRDENDVHHVPKRSLEDLILNL